MLTAMTKPTRVEMRKPERLLRQCPRHVTLSNTSDVDHDGDRK